MALSANRNLTTRNADGKRVSEHIILTSATIYKGSLVGLTAAGKAKVMANSATLKFVGICEEAPTGAGNGTYTVRCVTNLEVLLPTVTAITVGHTYTRKMYAVDDQTISHLTTLAPQVGIMVEYVAANSAWILLGVNPLSLAA